ncbi:MAG: glycosyltransferase [Methylobacter sp.]|nr:glycosyltransferase [Methylobacter sp.]MDP2430387.1 glycosyltransferase [Methylobacter sp.]MDP3053555.1 glycosyltransferase [Methylobacter sp.]MDP3362734.1 glycosyltransferase [Methylobacter sp.]MDZ4217758.1 glycosyltransferase [Methylobacter sp.]
MTLERTLVFAPHPDDEIIGCGGYIALKRLEKTAVRVIVVSDGALGLSSNQRQHSGLRQEESRLGLATLQLDDVQFWYYPDGAIPLNGAIIAAYTQAVIDFRPTRIMLPAPSEAHPDHRRVTRGVIRALEGNWAGDLWFYETTKPTPFINTVIDISATIATKLQALSAHASQLAQYDYAGHCDSLAQMRGIASGWSRGEAFLVFPWDGSPQHFFEARPLISVVVRADDGQILAHALASLAAQEYDQIEVVLVWFGNNAPDLSAVGILDIRVVSGKSNRGYNLNLGIAHARGEYIAFLDQDDIIYPEHLALLLAEIQGRAHVDVAYSGCRVVSCRRHGAMVEVTGEVEIMNRAVDAWRLMIGNAIPNHALLFRAQTFRTLHFDETLDAYEDWQLLAQLALDGYRFAHVDEITCEYRLYTKDGSITLLQAHREKNYFGWENRVYEAIAKQFNAVHLKTLAAAVAQLEKSGQDFAARLHNATQHIARLEAQLSEKEEWQDLLRRSLPAVGIDKVGKRGLARLIGEKLATNTLFSLIMPVYNTPAELLSEALGSIIGQNFPGWELCLVDDASTDPDTLKVLDDVRSSLQHSGKLQFKRRAVRGGIVAASNGALALASAPYVAFVDHDDVLHEDALLEIALVLKQEHPYKLIYTDSTMIDLAGRLLHVYRKPDWAPETLLHHNFINHLTVLQRDLLTQLGGLMQAYEGAQDWDMLLRVTEKLEATDIRHIRSPLYAWRAAEQSIAYRSSAKPAAFAAGQRAVLAHLQRKGLKQPGCTANPNGAGVICTWDSEPQSVEIIIPTHNNLDGLKVCIDGILTATDYPQAKITVIANRCENPEMRAYLKHLVVDRGINLVNDGRPFNWAALNNTVARHSHADLLLFMNDDVEVLSPDWLTSMARYAEIEGVGVVGATLRYPNGELQHNGVHTDTVSVASNMHSFGCYGELSVTRNVAAVTGACLLVARTIFNGLGGFDERFAVNYNDVDFCLAVRNAGYRIVQPNDVSLIHHESVSRGVIDNAEKKLQWEQEAALMRDKWGAFLADPYASEYEIYAQGSRILHVS